jgi:hypothetical protein
MAGGVISSKKINNQQWLAAGKIIDLASWYGENKIIQQRRLKR